MADEPVPGFWSRALASPRSIASAGIGSGAAFFIDAYSNIFPFAEPLAVMAPGAALTLGVVEGIAAMLPSRRLRDEGSEDVDIIKRARVKALRKEVSELDIMVNRGEMSPREYSKRVKKMTRRYQAESE